MKTSTQNGIPASKLSSISLLLLSVLLLPVFIAFVWLPVEKQQIKAMVSSLMKRDFPENELLWLKFSKAEANVQLKWEHTTEFMFRKRMYDVVEKIETKDSILIKCWFDSRETEINELLADIRLQQPINKQQKNAFQLIIIRLMNTLVTSNNAEMPLYAHQKNTIRPKNLKRYIFSSFPPDIPPPRS